MSPTRSGTESRVLLVTESFYPAVDGTTTTLKAVADRWIDRGVRIGVLTSGPGLSSYRAAPVHRVGPTTAPGAQVRTALETFRPDLVLVSNPGPVGRRALVHARRHGVRTLVVQHAPVPDLSWARWRTTVADQADRVLVTADWMRDRMASRGVATDRWAPGVDVDAFTPALRDQWLHGSWSRARAAGGPLVVVGYVGGLHRRNEVRQLAELATVPGIRPVVIGDGPQRDWLRRRLPSARFTGHLGTGDLTIALPSLDVVVHPGRQETCSHALREAGASGVPVVAPRAGGARDVVRHLESGLLYDPGVAGGLARAVSAVTADRHRALLGRRGRELATRTWRDAADELLDEHLHDLLPHRCGLSRPVPAG